ncbi:Sec-independent protein translocase protein TatB [Enterovibrio baiacu]|uniref:Sec-independent protein translocase protein TatB n=1 Tax=Enterovibrio baiacu TaxID=2491023 RepID=UPI00101191DD|nr:Sec-independent protein translocase protein TatB [Enterovibrio baiacu]MBE1277060.1 Sec-independent protein translocase subunit TatB [Enterovibrio baiacu]
MFDIGFWELILIAVVGLVVLGPERLPVAIRNVSRWIGAARRMAGSVRDELEQELKIQELQDNLKKAEQMGMQNLSPDLQQSVDELKKAAEDVQRPYSNKSAGESIANTDAANASSPAKDKTD